jgi:hypothetical protein
MVRSHIAWNLGNAGSITLATEDSRLADGLHHVEHASTGLFEYQLSDQGAKAPDVLPQGVILGFERKRLSRHVHESGQIKRLREAIDGKALMIRIVVAGRNVSAAMDRKRALSAGGEPH